MIDKLVDGIIALAIVAVGAVIVAALFVGVTLCYALFRLLIG